MSNIDRLLSLAIPAIRSNISMLKAPYKLTFSITYSCQSRCATCNIWQIKPSNELLLDEIKKFADRNKSFRWIEITGGEPFLRKDLVEIIRAFNETSKPYLFTMPTNSLCNINMIKGQISKILDLGIPKLSITVSLDGYRELHDKIRGVKGNYDKAINVFRMLEELKSEHSNLFFVFGYTLSKFNQGMFEKTFNSVREEIPSITYNDFHINLGQVSDIYYSNSDLGIKPGQAEVAKEIRQIREKRKAEIGAIPLIENAFLKGLEKYSETGKAPTKSRSMDASLFLDSYGNVFPSIMWNRKIGNVRDVDYDLSKIWHSRAADQARSEIKKGKDPENWTACEAYQSIIGDILHNLF